MRRHNHTANDRVSRENRQYVAQANKATAANTTPEDQICILDARLGAGVGAVRERARLTGSQPTGKVSRQKRAKQKARS
jgi:hypothetical protein